MPAQSGVVRTDPMNRTNSKHVHNYSTFKESLSYKLANTIRFGDLTPSFVMEGEPKDEITLNSKDMIDSLSLKAPFKGSIRKIKDSFAVPKMALLPLNWDKIYTQPVNGDDVPVDANCVIQNFPGTFASFWSGLWNDVVTNIPGSSATESDVAAWLTALVRVLILGEYVYSHGSLLNISGYKSSAQFLHSAVSVEGGYDEWFDLVMTRVFSNFLDFKVSIPNYLNSSKTRVFAGLGSNSPRYSSDRIGSFRRLLEIWRENPLCHFEFSASGDIEYNVDFATALADINSYASDPLFSKAGLAPLLLNFILPPVTTEPTSPTFDDSMSFNNLNLSRLLAYQMCAFHYFTNSAVDAVYSAELYREYLHALIIYLYTNNTFPTFSWNGMLCPYDYLSGKNLGVGLFLSQSGSLVSWTYTQISSPFSASNMSIIRLGVWAAIFTFRKSLRFGDYFVGSRPRPIAPINTDVAVNNNLVSVIDITKKQWAQKFGNAVMRSRQKIEEYVKGLFGDAPAPDYHNPFFLASESELIYGDEVQNTADAQQQDSNSRTGNFASNMNQYTFTFHNDDAHPCVYLQIISFDSKRYYSRSIERQFFVLDRYDMFNPDFQYIGDQPIFGAELGYPSAGYLSAVLTFLPNFAYTSRDMEYKQRFDQACGGFAAGQLPGWILTDLERSSIFDGYIDSDFIRSYNTELDQFYLSLSGLSLGTYFHFVCITNNFVNAKRAMAVDPQILGI